MEKLWDLVLQASVYGSIVGIVILIVMGFSFTGVCIWKYSGNCNSYSKDSSKR